MNCSYYRHLILKNESRLLKGRQADELNQHLINCKECLVFSKDQKNADNIVEQFKSVNPELNDPHGLTDQIILKIQQGEEKSVFKIFLNFVDKVLFLLDRKMIKYSLVITSIFLAIIFIRQQQILNHELRGLNRHIKQVNYNKEKDDFFRNKGYKILTKQLEKSSSIDEIQDEIRINRKDLNKLLEENNHLLEENRLLKEIIQKSIDHSTINTNNKYDINKKTL